jgi:hypothetical protein
MTYKIIFSDGYTDDFETIERGITASVLILDESGIYYNPFFLSMERVIGEFKSLGPPCYFQENLVILHEVTKDSILDSIPVLHKSMFFVFWQPMTLHRLEKYFYPKENWVYFDVICE